MKIHNLGPSVLSGVVLIGAILVQSGPGESNAYAQTAQQARPTVAPLPTRTPAAVSRPLAATGGEIVLTHEIGLHGLRAVVQWQGSDGRWYDVDGWRSELGSNPVTWWVAPGDSGTGPFRWAVFRAGNSEPLRVTPSFKLPGTGQRLQIALTD